MAGVAGIEPTIGAWRSLMDAHAAVLDRLSDDLEREMGMPVHFFDVLWHLYEAPAEQLPMRELADRVLISKSGLTRLVDRMMTEGLVERKPCASDRRVVYAALTDAGRERLVRAAPIHQRGIAEYFGRHFDAAEADTLKCLLARVADANNPRLCAVVEEASAS